MSETQLAKIKRRLGIAQDDTAENDLLADLVDDAESYFKTLTGSVEIGSKYNFMIEKKKSCLGSWQEVKKRTNGNQTV